MNPQLLPANPRDDAAGWEQTVMAFLAEKERRSGSRRTVESYARILWPFFGRVGSPDKVTPAHVLVWAHGIGASGREPSSATVGARIACLSSYYRFLIRMNVMTGNPCDALERPRTVQSVARGLGADEVRRLLSVVPGLMNPPYSQKGVGLHELDFIDHLLDCLAPGSLGVAIVPMSCGACASRGSRRASGASCRSPLTDRETPSPRLPAERLAVPVLAVAHHEPDHRCRAADLPGDVHQPPVLRPEPEGQLLLLGGQVSMSTLHQRPPAICVDSSHRTRCDDDLNPPSRRPIPPIWRTRSSPIVLGWRPMPLHCSGRANWIPSIEPWLSGWPTRRGLGGGATP